MRMNKTISVFFLSFLMIISLAGCGSGGGATTPSAADALPSGSDGGSTRATTSTGVVKLSWDSPQADVVGFKVYYGTTPGNYTSTVDAGITPTYTVSGLSLGTYYFVVTAIDSAGNESGFSNEASKTII